jgi:hypothetical protein
LYTRRIDEDFGWVQNMRRVTSEAGPEITSADRRGREHGHSNAGSMIANMGGACLPSMSYWSKRAEHWCS